MESTENELALRAKPAPGWLAVIPIPGSEIQPEEGERQPPKAVLRIVAEHMNASVDEVQEMMTSVSIGQIGGLVMDVGTLPEGVFPYRVGDTVYFPADRGIDIGAYKFLIADRVIAYTRDDDN